MDPVTRPTHYNQGSLECIDAMIEAFGREAVATYCRVNAFKYLWRSEYKNGAEDIQKADFYLRFWIFLEGRGPDPRDP